MNKIRSQKNRIINKDIGKRIAKFRRKAGMTQVQLAKKVGLTENWIQQIEYGNTEPSVAKLIIFAEALGITVNDLLTDSDRKEKEG